MRNDWIYLIGMSFIILILFGCKDENEPEVFCTCDINGESTRTHEVYSLTSNRIDSIGASIDLLITFSWESSFLNLAVRNLVPDGTMTFIDTEGDRDKVSGSASLNQVMAHLIINQYDIQPHNDKGFIVIDEFDTVDSVITGNFDGIFESKPGYPQKSIEFENCNFRIRVGL
jgi:hypothetical protein